MDAKLMKSRCYRLLPLLLKVLRAELRAELRTVPLAASLSVLLVACAGSGPTDNTTQTQDAAVEATTYPVTDGAPVANHEAQATPTKSHTYEVVLERVKARAYADDFRLLREEFVKTDLYKPFDSAEREQTQQMFEAFDNNNLKLCLSLADRILARNFLSLPAHRAAAICNEQRGDDMAQQFHDAMYRGLLDAVARSGNGSSPAAAFVVITVDEIDALLQAQDLEVVSQSQLQQGEHEYNRVFVRNPQTGRQFYVYFDVSAEKRWYLNRLRSR